MFKIEKSSLLATSAIFSTVLVAYSSAASAQEVNIYDETSLKNYVQLYDSVDSNLEVPNNNALEQVTNVNQLRDVAPTDWAYEALRSLVDRYGCIAGFPNQTYRGNQPLSRYEFAAGLNSCLNQIERLIASSEAVNREDLEAISRLNQEFEAELATLGGRIDNIESRTAFLEDNAFSTTTKLEGEVAFTIAQAFGDQAAADLNQDGELNDALDSEVVFTNRVRLQLVSSFTGKDKLFTRLTAGNIDNSFQDETGTREGRFAYDGQTDNNVTIDRLHYVFPVGENLKVTAMASLAAHHFYAETFNSGLNTGGGASGALTRFGERSPIYRLGIANSSAGLGLNYQLGEKFEIAGGYIAPTASNPAEENGLFTGSFSALGQLTFKPLEKLKVGLTYVRTYDPAAQADPPTVGGRAPFLWGGTGTNLANFRSPGLNIDDIATDSFGAQFQFDLNPRISLRGWFSYTDATLFNSGDGDDGEATVLNYAGALVFSDLLKEGSLAALVVGAEPYLNSIDSDGDGNDDDITSDIPLHIEAFYKYPFNDNISITPGVIWLVSPNQNSDNDSIFIGALRTTFSF
ncbi:MAG: iron uptake porin [Pleurocapsa sp.]